MTPIKYQSLFMLQTNEQSKKYEKKCPSLYSPIEPINLKKQKNKITKLIFFKRITLLPYFNR